MPSKAFPGTCIQQTTCVMLHSLTHHASTVNCSLCDEGPIPRYPIQNIRSASACKCFAGKELEARELYLMPARHGAILGWGCRGGLQAAVSEAVERQA